MRLKGEPTLNLFDERSVNMAATGLVLWQGAVGFDIVSMFSTSNFAVVAFLVLTVFVLAFVYWKRKRSQAKQR
jgi:hypothetical protein